MHGGATTIGPDVTRPPAICQNLWGAGGGGIGSSTGGGGSKEGGAARDPLLPHAYLKGVCVFGGMGV